MDEAVIASILTNEAQQFLTELHRKFESTRQVLLAERLSRQRRIQSGEVPDFLSKTMREQSWQVAAAPADLNDRRVEITGPVDRKMMINALNSGAHVFMADFEDSLSPTWENVIQGQVNLQDAVRRTLSFVSPEGKTYRLNPEIATLLVRPRGWHLNEKHFQVDRKPISASLFDFGLYFFHNAQELIKRGSGPYFYLPKMEGHREARLWNEVFLFAQEKLGIARGSIRATVLIETILAAFEMEEILYELREHAAGLNAGRWDYIFSCIKKFHANRFIFPDRAQVTMTVPFMRAYAGLLVRTCHQHGAHAIGGMSAFIPSRRDEEISKIALKNVRDDKDREVSDGFDGTWVAHPDLVSVARESFDRVLGSKPHQKNQLREDLSVRSQQLIDFQIPDGTITEAGVRKNISVALQYLNSWLEGQGAAAIDHLMEDAATAEISRAQLWQWVHRQAQLSDGREMSQELYQSLRTEEWNKLSQKIQGRLGEAVELLDQLVLSREFSEFLTLLAYDLLEREK